MFTFKEKIIKQENILNFELQNVTGWIRSNELTLHNNKTWYMISQSSALPHNITVKMNNPELKHVDKMKVLGIIADRKLTCKPHSADLKVKKF